MYEDDELEQLPSNLLPTLNRFKWYLVVAIPLLLVICLFTIQLVPVIYRAPASVMVETQQIPTDLVQSTITSAASEQIDVMRQRVMTRENLLAILNKYDHFQLKGASPLQTTLALREFREQVKQEVVSTNKGRSKVAIGFSISYGSIDPVIAQSVTNDLVSLFLSENVKARTERASETTDFLVAEANKIRAELDEIEATVAEFKRENKDSLPEHLSLYVGMREDARKRLIENERSINNYHEQVRSLNTQLSVMREQSGGHSGRDTEIAELRTKYRELQLTYQGNHPDLVILREKIDLIEGGSKDSKILNSYSGAEQEIINQIASLKKLAATLEKEHRKEKANLADIEQRIIRIPQVERGFASIERDYETKSEQYEAIITKTQNAEMAESLEQERKAERFILLEPPVLPTTPSEPDKKKLLLLAVVCSFGFPIGIVFSIGILDKTIRTRKAIEVIVGENPLVEIPYIKVQSDYEKQKKQLIYSGASAMAVTIAVMVVVQVYITPLDIALLRVIENFGI